MLSSGEKSKLREDIHSNQHEIYVISFEEMDKILKNSHLAVSSSVKESWQKIKKKAQFGASWYASADDIRTLSKLVGDLGGWGTRVYIKHYGGNPHIILKGSPRLRLILTGTKYGVNNTKVITMGLGRAGAMSAAKSGAILSIVLMTIYRVADYVLTDEATLSQLIGSLATDVVKIGISTAASMGAASLVAGFCSLAVGPIVAVVVVGIGVSWLLGEIDEHYHITDKVIAGLEEMSNDVDAYFVQKAHQLEDAVGDAADSVIDYVLDSASQVIINLTKHTIDKLINPQLRVNF